MKKFVAVLAVLFCFMLCSCSKDTSGYTCELTQNKWSATLEGGASVSLSFENDRAHLNMKNGENSVRISGKYIADNKSFVVFVPQIKQNYYFEYTAKGKNLYLSYKNSRIKLNIS